MNIFNFTSKFLTIILSFLAFSHCYSQDLLHEVQSDSKLVGKLKDGYQAFHINHIIAEQKEIF